MEFPEASSKTIALQAQFICPIFTVWYGRRCELHHSRYHAEQMVRALRLNGTPVAAFDGKGVELAPYGWSYADA